MKINNKMHMQMQMQYIQCGRVNIIAKSFLP